MNNEDLFISGEADAMFIRNKDSLQNKYLSDDLLLRLIDLYNIKPKSACEVGGGSGVRVGKLAGNAQKKNFWCVDPSAQAIKEGQKRFPNVNFMQATAATMELKRQFELVIVNFVFMYIDRSLLFKSIAKIDEICVDGGYLIIGDFLPLDNQIKVRYHHIHDHEVYIHKQNYAKIFTTSGTYKEIALMTSEIEQYPKLTCNGHPMNQQGVWLLRKTQTDKYIEMEYIHP